MSIKDRFKMIMERENLTAGAFAESIGVAQATISHILGPRNKYPSTEVILRLHNKYSDINLNWLLTGEGNMSDSESDSSDETDTISFAENAENASCDTDDGKNRKETNLESYSGSANESVKQTVIYRDKPARKITEIRIFFDDNTFEIFKPEK